MSNLTRYTQQIFGSSAGTNQMSEFGSLAASTPATYSGATITPAIIQTLANYLEGWKGAVLGQNSPAIEDMNSLCYLFAYQLSYLMQKGVAEWDAGTTYYIGNIVQSSGVLYASLTNTNLNNPVTDGANWLSPSSAGLSFPKALPFTAGTTFQANESTLWPNLTIGNGQTVVVPNNAYVVGVTNITISGTGVLQITGTGTVRIL